MLLVSYTIVNLNEDIFNAIELKILTGLIIVITNIQIMKTILAPMWAFATPNVGPFKNGIKNNLAKPEKKTEKPAPTSRAFFNGSIKTFVQLAAYEPSDPYCNSKTEPRIEERSTDINDNNAQNAKNIKGHTRTAKILDDIFALLNKTSSLLLRHLILPKQ